MRESGRLFFVATIPLAIVASIGMLGVYKKFGLGGIGKISATALICILIILDYAGIPLPGHTNAFVDVSIPKVYGTLSGAKTNQSAFILPAQPLPPGGYLYPAILMYYQTAFKEPIISGYTSRINSTQANLAEAVPLSVFGSRNYTDGLFSYPSPAEVNLTNLTISFLLGYNVNRVGIMKPAYPPEVESQLSAYMYSVFGQPFANDSNAIFFSTENVVMPKLVYYPTGAWVQGYQICNQTGVGCSSAFSEPAWWGLPQRNVTILSQRNATATATFNAMAYNGSETLDVYYGPAGKQIASIPLSTDLKSYNVTLDLTKGSSVLEFSSSLNSSDVLTYDIQNLTIADLK
jgi:hypothetical protein